MVNLEATPRTLTFAHSPDPDDAYMFYGFHTGAVQMPGYEIGHHLEDIQSLNEKAFKGEFEITAVSAHAYAHLSDKYWVLNCGASVGRKYGPILVARKDFEFGISNFEFNHKPSNPKSEIQNPKLRIGIPGKWTTAALVLDLWLAETGQTNVEKVFLPFDQLLDAVEQGKIDRGLIIHEGQLTFSNQGLEKVWDSGEWWDQKTNLPLPLGLDVVRSDLGLDLAREIGQAFRQSIRYAQAHHEEAVKYALPYGRGLDQKLADKFIGMYVNQDTLDQGIEFQEGLKTLYSKAFSKNLIPSVPTLTFV